MEPNKKICWKVTVSLMYAIQSGRPKQGWRFLLFESYFKMPHIIWFLRKIAEILWRWSQSRKPGGAGVNRKHIKIPVNGENGFKYEDNTCQSVRLWVTSQIVRSVRANSPQSWPALTRGKNKSNIQFAWDMRTQIFCILYSSPGALSVFTSIISPCLGQEAEKLRTADIPSPGSDLIPHPEHSPLMLSNYNVLEKTFA